VTLSTADIIYAFLLAQLPNNILDSIERISAPSIKSADIKTALRDAHLLTNEKVRTFTPRNCHLCMTLYPHHWQRIHHADACAEEVRRLAVGHHVGEHPDARAHAVHQQRGRLARHPGVPEGEGLVDAPWLVSLSRSMCAQHLKEFTAHFYYGLAICCESSSASFYHVFPLIPLVVYQDGRLIAKPLSNDQTPYRKDERERIKKTGARVLSMDQIEGLEPVHENWGDLNLGKSDNVISIFSSIPATVPFLTAFGSVNFNFWSGLRNIFLFM
jgi:hypothetical protein